MLDARVGRLEDDIKDVKRDIGAMRETLARVDGRVSAMPSAFQLYVAILVTWGAGAGIAFALIRLSTG